MSKVFTIASLIFTAASFLAQAQTEEENKFEKEPLPSTINTKYIEARPLISGDGKTLFFNRRLYPENFAGVKDFQDIYVANYNPETDTWSQPQNIGKTLNDRQANAVASVNSEGTEGIFFNTYTKGKRAPLARSRQTANGWTKPTPINIQNFVNVNDFADYHYDFRENVLFLAIEGDVTQGQQDIYVSLPDGFGNWKEPINLGNVINTREAEFSPFLGSDGRSLFFASYGHDGMGGSDIFMSVRLDDTWLRWSTPVNLGKPINSNQEESYFSITDDFKYLYYTTYSARQTNRDIVRVRLPEDFTAVNGPVIAQLDSAAISKIMLSGNYTINQEGARRNFEGVSFEGWPEDEGVEESLTEDSVQVAENNTTSSRDATTTTANTAANVPEGETSRYTGFIPVSDANNLSPEAQELKRYLQQKLAGTELLVRQDGGTVEFKIVQNLEYDFNSVFVTPNYLPRLRSIGNILKDKENLKVQLIGHTDEVGSPEANERVARQRVENLNSYFKRRGIDDNRIEIVSAGSAEPLASNDSEANRRQNRRVETILVFNK